jgi:hypothetical protein
MTKLVLADAFMFFGLCAFLYGLYNLIRRKESDRYLLWCLAGHLTAVGTLVDTTVLVYFARNGHEGSMTILHNTLNAVMLGSWLYVVYKKGVFANWKN